MSRVLKIRLGARQARILRDLMTHTMLTSEDSAVVVVCAKVINAISYRPPKPPATPTEKP